MAGIALVFAFANFCIVYLPKLVQANKITEIKVVNNSSTLSFQGGTSSTRLLSGRGSTVESVKLFSD